MEPSKAAMKAALRVLTALSEHRRPDAADVDELHWYASSDRDRPLDELVCDAIQRALKDREEKRKAVKVQMRRRALALGAAGLESVAIPASRMGSSEPPASAEPQQEYLALIAKVKRLGIALQKATAGMIAAEAGACAASSQTAKEILESISDEVDVSGILQLLDEHIRLTKDLDSGRKTPKRRGAE